MEKIKVCEKNVRGMKRAVSAQCDNETELIAQKCKWSWLCLKAQMLLAAKPGLATLYPPRTTMSCNPMPYQAFWEGPSFQMFSGTGSFYFSLY